jgi:hypothetical protein
METHRQPSIEEKVAIIKKSAVLQRLFQPFSGQESDRLTHFYHFSNFVAGTNRQIEQRFTTEYTNSVLTPLAVVAEKRGVFAGGREKNRIMTQAVIAIGYELEDAKDFIKIAGDLVKMFHRMGVIEVTENRDDNIRKSEYIALLAVVGVKLKNAEGNHIPSEMIMAEDPTRLGVFEDYLLKLQDLGDEDLTF